MQMCWGVCSGHNIPDDNLVELHVRKLKELLRQQGGNVSFESAKVACATCMLVILKTSY